MFRQTINSSWLRDRLGCMLVESDRILPPGKLPGDMLGALLSSYVHEDSSVLIGPGIGRDAAVIRVGERVIVVKTDPITFATSDVGRYLVNVNANDIVCMGATPRWLLVTALFPEQSTTPRLVEDVFSSLSEAATELGIALAGGHTEITLGLDRPILVGQMIGEASSDEILDLQSAETGDAIVLCTPVAVEGTAILATEAENALATLDPLILSRAKRLVNEPGISILPAARAIRSAGIDVRGFHDPTEGGVVTALTELGVACNRGIEVWIDEIPVLAETKAICSVLGLDPLGLIASGSLLVVLPDSRVQSVLDVTAAIGIKSAQVGCILDYDTETTFVIGGERHQPYRFAVDEIARYLAGAN